MFSLFYKKGTKNLLSQKKCNKIMKKRKGKIKRTVEIRENQKTNRINLKAGYLKKIKTTTKQTNIWQIKKNDKITNKIQT